MTRANPKAWDERLPWWNSLGIETLWAMAGMNVSIYNHQLCVLHRSLWRYARKSISDFNHVSAIAINGTRCTL
jgi:hypothetical protein